MLRVGAAGLLLREAKLPGARRLMGEAVSLFGVGFRRSGVGGDDGGGEKHSDEGDTEKKVMHGVWLLCGVLLNP